MSWKEMVVTDLRKTLPELMEYQFGHQQWLWRGEPEMYADMLPSIARRPWWAELDEDSRIKQEACMCERFMEVCRLYASDPERGAIMSGYYRPTLRALAWAAHQGFATRLLDWSMSPFVGLFFACTKLGADGRLWGFRAEQLKVVSAANQQDLFDYHEGEFLFLCHGFQESTRQIAQQGVFTVANRLDADHGRLIAQSVADGGAVCYRIPSDYEVGLLGRLRTLGVTPESLHYPIFDHIARAESRDWQDGPRLHFP